MSAEAGVFPKLQSMVRSDVALRVGIGWRSAGIRLVSQGKLWETPEKLRTFSFPIQRSSALVSKATTGPGSWCGVTAAIRFVFWLSAGIGGGEEVVFGRVGALHAIRAPLGTGFRVCIEGGVEVPGLGTT